MRGERSSSFSRQRSVTCSTGCRLTSQTSASCVPPAVRCPSSGASYFRAKTSDTALLARTSRLRVRWYGGYFSEYPLPLDGETRAVSLNVDADTVTVHATTGGVHRFTNSACTDDEGHTVYEENPSAVESSGYIADAPARAPLSPAETFAYVITPSAGVDGLCHVRLREPGDGAGQPSAVPGLLGCSPAARFEDVGLLRGGGPLSPLCGLVPPSVLATRLVLRAGDRSNGAVAAAWFHVDQSLVRVLTPADNERLVRRLAATTRCRRVRVNRACGHLLRIVSGCLRASPGAQRRSQDRALASDGLRMPVSTSAWHSHESRGTGDGAAPRLPPRVRRGSHSPMGPGGWSPLRTPARPSRSCRHSSDSVCRRTRACR
jgi:hypothetical protein